MRELEDFTAEACRLVLRGQFPREAFEKVGLSERDIKEIERIRVENAKSNDYTYFRQIFRREMYTQVVANLKKVGLMTEHTADNLRKLGINPNVDGRAYSLEQTSA
jgi:predicted NUDIX family phosphoesterase